MSLVALLGFKERRCGCVIGRYLDLGSNREVTYVEQWGSSCEPGGHRDSEPHARTFRPSSVEPGVGASADRSH